MKKQLKYITVLLLATFIVSCEQDPKLLDNGLAPSYSFAVESTTVGVCNPTVTYTVETTKAPQNDLTVNVVLSDSDAADSEFSFDTSVTIPAGEYLGTGSFTVDFLEVPDGATRIVSVELQIPEGGTLNARSPKTFEFSSACALNEVIFDFTFDDFPGEFVWQLYDSTGTFIAGDTAFGNYADLDSFTTTLCLPDDTYTLRLLDGFGDGFCCAYGTGSAVVSLNDCVEGAVELLSISEEHTGGEFLANFTVGN